MAGWSLYIDELGRPTFLYNWFGHVLTNVAGSNPLEPGERTVRVHYQHDGGFSAGGVATLFVDDANAGSERIPRTVPIRFSGSNETFDVGIDTDRRSAHTRTGSPAPPGSRA